MLVHSGLLLFLLHNDGSPVTEDEQKAILNRLISPWAADD